MPLKPFPLAILIQKLMTQLLYIIVLLANVQEVLPKFQPWVQQETMVSDVPVYKLSLMDLSEPVMFMKELQLQQLIWPV